MRSIWNIYTSLIQMATIIDTAAVKKNSEWCGNAYLYVMGDPTRKSYPRNSHGYEPVEAFFPAKHSTESESDSDSGTEELVQERYQRLLEAREKKLAREREKETSAAQQATTPTHDQTQPEPVEDVSVSCFPVSTPPLVDDREATFTKSPHEPTAMETVNEEKELDETVSEEKELDERVSKEKELDETVSKEGISEPSVLDTVNIDKEAVIEEKDTVREENGVLEPSVSKQYSPDQSIAHPTLPSHTAQLQPSRLTYEATPSESDGNTQEAPTKSVRAVTKKSKRRTITLRGKRKSKRSIRTTSESSPGSTDETISFNPPISSTMYADLASAKASKKKTKKQTIISKLKQSESESEMSDDLNMTMERLLGGALSRLSKYQRLLSKGQSTKPSQVEEEETTQTDTPIEEPAVTTKKSNRKSNAAKFTVNNLVPQDKLRRSDQLSTSQESTHSPHKNNSGMNNSPPASLPALEDTTPSPTSTPPPISTPLPALEDNTPSSMLGNVTSSVNTPTSQRSVLKVKRFSIRLTKMSPQKTPERSTKKKPGRKVGKKSNKTATKPSAKMNQTVNSDLVQSSPLQDDNIQVDCLSPDMSVLPMLNRKRKKSPYVLPSRPEASKKPKPSPSEANVTLSPGGREYRRYKIDNDQAKTPGVRRSKRNRIAPVKTWLGERVEYDMRRRSGMHLKGLLVPMYDIDEAPAPKKKTTKRRSKSPQEDEATNSDFETLTFTNTQGEDKEWTVVRTKASACQIAGSELANIEYQRLFSTSDFAYGVITFLPLAVKERSSNSNHEIVFHIVGGRLQFTVNDQEYNVRAGMTVHIPPDSHYKVQNTHRSTAEVFYLARSIEELTRDQSQTQ